MQEFQGDEAAKLCVLGFVDHTHAAAAEFLDDAVVRDGLADHGVGAMVGVAWGQVNEAVELRGLGGIVGV